MVGRIFYRPAAAVRKKDEKSEEETGKICGSFEARDIDSTAVIVGQIILC